VLLIRELMELAGRRVRLEPTGLFAFLQQDEEGDDPPRSTGAGLQIYVRRWWGRGNASCMMLLSPPHWHVPMW
jgi:hypothetical protein